MVNPACADAAHAGFTITLTTTARGLLEDSPRRNRPYGKRREKVDSDEYIPNTA
jgi:hypothetical protein